MQIRNLNGYSNTITKSLQKIAIFWCSVSGRQHGGAIVKFIECYQWIPIAVERVEVRNGANILLIACSNTNLWTISFRVHYLETWCPKKKSIFFCFILFHLSGQFNCWIDPKNLMFSFCSIKKRNVMIWNKKKMSFC